MRVKILFNKKENALVQMSDSTQAQLGNLLHMLSGLLWSSVCRETDEERKKQKYHIKLNVPTCYRRRNNDNEEHRYLNNGVCNLSGGLYLSVCSYEPPERPAAAREVTAHHAVKTHQRPASPWRPRGPGPDQRLQQLPPAPLQEARLQKLQQHLPTVCHFTPLQHPVSPSTAGASTL